MNKNDEKTKVRTMMLIGAPTVGKTSYISLALGYLQLLSCDKYALMPTREEDYEVTATRARNMQKGKWPSKTLDTGLWDVTVRHHYTVPALGPYAKDEKVEWSGTQVNKALLNMLPWRGGEVTERICFYDCAGEDFTGNFHDGTGGNSQPKVNGKVLKRCQESDYFLLFIDAEKIRDDNQEVRDVLKRAAYLLEERAKSKPNTKFHVAVIFTKCDTLLDHKAFMKEDGTGWDGDKVRQEFNELYISDIARIAFHKNLVTEYFCVSCVPDLSHTETDPAGGVIATEEWNPRDMAGQLAPLRWISSHFY